MTTAIVGVLCLVVTVVGIVGYELCRDDSAATYEPEHFLVCGAFPRDPESDYCPTCGFVLTDGECRLCERELGVVDHRNEHGVSSNA